MLIRHPRVLRFIASGLLVQSVSQLILPSVSYALTAGPTAPEATSFEPVDTTDMVNLNSGDLTYNIPLLEIPGPEGGYPLALSYHAGIQPNEEASWVGLGWSLNPGAISRNVNGYADDHQNVSQVTHDFWEGGHTSTYTVGATVGAYLSPASVSFGLSFSQDTYKGFGLGNYVGVNVGIGSTPASVGVNVAQDGYGGTSAGVHVGAGLGSGAAQGLSLGVSAGLSTNFQSISTNAGAGISAHGDKGAHNTSLLGASISSGSSKPSFTVGGGSIGIYNSQAGRIQTQSNGFSLDVPVLPYVSISLGYNYMRYWSDEEQSAYTNGALYYPKTYQSASGDYYDNHAFDTYRLPDPFTDTENFIDNPDPDLIQGGSFPDYDNYYVTAQGLSGSIRPYAFQHALVSRTKKQGGGAISVKSGAISIANGSVSFRFVNDFSNQYTQSPSANWYNNTGQLAYPFDQNPTFGNNDGNYGYNATKNQLVGSKHIEWFTNHDIAAGIATQKGFVDTSSPGFARTDNSVMGPQVGGFMITNESGVTYHYALPAYSFNEHVYSEIVDHSNGLSYNHLSKPSKYAYTWFLTAVTGPDYVDRGTTGLDENDWGYWVSFSYGKWSDNYNWRNPSEGFHRDLDGQFQSFSTGSKELYYLNSISTRTHTAIFEKTFRVDGKGATDILGEPDKQHDNNTQATYTPREEYILNNGQSFDIFHYPALQLRLNRVLLFNNQDLPKNLIQVYSASTTFNLNDTTSQPDDYSFIETVGYSHHGENIADVEDINNLGKNFVSKAIRIITIQHDYSLTPGTINSYGTESNPYANTNPTVKQGKLTLNGISFGGLGGTTLMPTTKFYYDFPQAKGEQIKVNNVSNGSPSNNSVGEIQLAANTLFKAGDVIKISINSLLVYATILEQTPTQLGSVNFPVRYLTYPYLVSGVYQAVVTKNPPYLKEAYDSWGMFKSDFNDDITGISATSITRRPTKLSNGNADAWSLRRIVSPLGATIKVKYAGDEYQEPVLAQPKILANTAGGTTIPNEANQGIGHIYTGSFSYEQALQLFAPNQIIHVAGLTGKVYEIPNNYGLVNACDKNAFRYEADIQLKILSVDNIKNRGDLTVQVMNQSQVGEIFYIVGHDCMGISTGYIKAIDQSASKINYGGGIRVATVSVVDGAKSHTTSYNYANSGTTSYEPISYYSINQRAYQNYLDRYSFCSQAIASAKTYNDSYRKQLPMLMAVSREAVPPGVMYGRVTVSEAVTDAGNTFANLGSIGYQFEVFNRSMIGIVGASYQNVTPTSNVEFRTKQMAIKDMTSSLGNLKRVTHYDSQGKVLTETINQYASDDIAPTYLVNNDSPALTGYIARTADAYEQKLAAYNYQGLIKESYGDYREVRRLDGNYDTKGVISQRETYPNIQTGSVTTDYRTGIRATAQTLGFDFYSGAPTSSVATDGYGNRWLTRTVPAYRQYPAMGPIGSPAVNGATELNRNMLSQIAATYVYKADAVNKPVSLQAASAQTWSDARPVLGTDPSQPFVNGTQPTIWRPWASYAWMPTTNTSDGLTPLGSFAAFVFGSTAPAAPWQKVSEITRYNVFSNALEASDLNGQYLATKMGFNQSRVLVTGGPARYTELAYTGAEEVLADNYLGEDLRPYWSDPTGAEVYTDVPASGKVHTGTHSVRIHSQRNGLAFSPSITKLSTNKGYRASVWATSPAAGLYYCIDSDPSRAVTVPGKVTQQANGWYLLTLDIPPLTGARTDLRVGVWNGTGQDIYVDDFRFQPVNAATAAYVYDQQTGQVTDILDNTNLYTHYEYDAAGRLKRVRHETFDLPALSPSQTATQYTYHYARQPLPLDAPDLQVIAGPSSNLTTQFTVQATGLTANDYTISYKSGAVSNSAFITLRGQSTFNCTYPAAGTYWATVRLTDTAGGQVREFAVKVIVQ